MKSSRGRIAASTIPVAVVEVVALQSPPPPEDGLTLIVRDQNDDDTFFKIRRNTKMGKIFQAVAQRKVVQCEALRFLVGGSRILDDDTPQMLQLEDGDEIYCSIEQAED